MVIEAVKSFVSALKRELLCEGEPEYECELEHEVEVST